MMQEISDYLKLHGLTLDEYRAYEFNHHGKAKRFDIVAGYKGEQWDCFFEIPLAELTKETLYHELYLKLIRVLKVKKL